MAIQGVGGQLQLNIASVLTTVAGVYDVDGPQGTVDDINVSSLQSASAAKEFLPGMFDGGTVQLECRYDHIQWGTLYGTYRVMQAWRILYNDGSKWDFNGYINSMSPKMPLEDEVGSPFSIKISGKPVFTP